MTDEQKMREEQLLMRAAKQLQYWHKKYCEHNPDWLPPGGDVVLLEDIDEFLNGRRASTSNTQVVQREPIQLNIIREWPDGFEDRLQSLWFDVASMIPNVKLYDLQRVLAKFGFEMVVYEPSQTSQPQEDSKP